MNWISFSFSLLERIMHKHLTLDLLAGFVRKKKSILYVCELKINVKLTFFAAVLKASRCGISGLAALMR